MLLRVDACPKPTPCIVYVCEVIKMMNNTAADNISAGSAPKQTNHSFSFILPKIAFEKTISIPVVALGPTWCPTYLVALRDSGRRQTVKSWFNIGISKHSTADGGFSPGPFAKNVIVVTTNVAFLA